MPWSMTAGYAVMGLLALVGCLGSFLVLAGQRNVNARGHVTFFFVINVLLLILAMLGLSAQLENPWQAIMSLALVLCTRLLNGLMFFGFSPWAEVLNWGLGLLAAALVLL